MELEAFLLSRIREAVEVAAAECIREINQKGAGFVQSESGQLQWVSEASGEVVEVTCPIGVGVSSISELPPAPDPATDLFISRAQSGTDRVAEVLNLVEGNIANGGFSQLFVNQDVSEVREAVGYLKTIGAQSAARIVSEAADVFDGAAEVVAAYQRLQEALGRLDIRYNRLRVNIPELYMRHVVNT